MKNPSTWSHQVFIQSSGIQLLPGVVGLRLTAQAPARFVAVVLAGESPAVTDCQIGVGDASVLRMAAGVLEGRLLA